MKKIKSRVAKEIAKILGDEVSKDILESRIKINYDDADNKGVKKGDLSLPTFDVARSLKQNPKELAQRIAESFKDETITVEAMGPFVNFYLDRAEVVKEILDQVVSQGQSFGSNQTGLGKLIIMDYSSPNIGKPLHVGHIRSTILGDSILRIARFCGHTTQGINYLGDIGLHLGKIIYAYKNWGSEERIRENPEEEILKLYIEFGQREKEDESLTDLAKKEIELIESKDPESQRILEFIHERSMEVFHRIYGMLGVEFDEITGQSNFSEKGKEIVRNSLENGIAVKTDDGAVKILLEEYGLPEKLVLRKDGTAIYSTQDIGAAVERAERFSFDKSLYVVATEQDLYFKQLFATLGKLGYDWAENLHHVSFGMINLPEGRMSTREGAIVYLEEVLNKAVGRARELVEEKSPDLTNKDEIARIVGIGSVKYMVLSVDPQRNINFTWERALDLNGSSAPYIQYTYARANSILQRCEGLQKGEFSPSNLDNDAEYQLVKKLGEFPTVVERSMEGYCPNIVANYAADLSSTFNGFYNDVRILDSGEKMASKLLLVKSYMTIIGNAMSLLGIELPNKM